jgi:hypothetical protein
VREEKHTVAAEEPRAVDDIGAALADQLDQLGKLLGRVLEIGVLDDDQVARDLLEAAPQRRSFAAVLGLENQLELQLLGKARQDVARAVLRPVVNDDQLDPDRNGDHTPDDLFDRLPLVVARHDDREQGILQDSAKA